MVGNSTKIVAASLVTLATLGAPTVVSAQGYGYDDRSTVAVQCGRGQRAVMTQQRFNGRTRTVARCEAARDRRGVYDDYGRGFRARPSAYDEYPVARRPPARYEYRERRSKTKSALMIAGAAAAGAGVGGALKGKTGALVGAAIGGGSASIYEASKRR